MNSSRTRTGTSRALPIALAVVLGAVTLQLALAGASAFGARGWGMHAMLGGLIGLLAVASLALALIARPGGALLAATAAILVLAGVQPLLARLAQGSSPWFGLLHAADAVPLLALAAWGIWASMPRSRPDTLAAPGAS